MSNVKLGYKYSIMIISSCCVNILVFINILSFDSWRFGSFLMLLSSIMLPKKKYLKITEIEFCMLMICLVIQLATLFKHIYWVNTVK